MPLWIINASTPSSTAPVPLRCSRCCSDWLNDSWYRIHLYAVYRHAGKRGVFPRTAVFACADILSLHWLTTTNAFDKTHVTLQPYSDVQTTGHTCSALYKRRCSSVSQFSIYWSATWTSVSEKPDTAAALLPAAPAPFRTAPTSQTETICIEDKLWGRQWKYLVFFQ